MQSVMKPQTFHPGQNLAQSLDLYKCGIIGKPQRKKIANSVLSSISLPAISSNR